MENYMSHVSSNWMEVENIHVNFNDCILYLLSSVDFFQN